MTPYGPTRRAYASLLATRTALRLAVGQYETRPLPDYRLASLLTSAIAGPEAYRKQARE